MGRAAGRRRRGRETWIPADQRPAVGCRPWPHMGGQGRRFRLQITVKSDAVRAGAPATDANSTAAPAPLPSAS